MRVHISISKVHRIARVTREQFDKLSNSEQTAYLKEYPHSSFKESGLSLRNIKQDVADEAAALSKHLNISKEHLINALLQKDVKQALSHGIKTTVHALDSTLSFINTAARSTFEEIAKTNAIKKLQKKTMTVDVFLDKYPKVKKMAGPIVAGALVYQWMHMSFSGDFDEDFDLTSISSALAGEYSVHNLLSSASGLKAMAQLAIGVATAGLISFPWSSSLNIMFAAAYTGAKKLKDSKVLNLMSSKISKQNSSYITV